MYSALLTSKYSFKCTVFVVDRVGSLCDGNITEKYIVQM